MRMGPLCGVRHPQHAMGYVSGHLIPEFRFSKTRLILTGLELLELSLSVLQSHLDFFILELNATRLVYNNVVTSGISD